VREVVMRSAETKSCPGTVSDPVVTANRATLRKVPQWIGGLLGSTNAAAFIRRKESELPVREPPTDPPEEPTAELAEAEAAEQFETSGNSVSLVDEMLSRGRYALLLRPQLIVNLSTDQLARARAALSEGMCLVPAGEVIVHRTTGAAESPDDLPGHEETPVCVDGYYLDRYQVSNAQFHRFVRHGGYEQMAIWDPEVLPAVRSNRTSRAAFLAQGSISEGRGPSSGGRRLLVRSGRLRALGRKAIAHGRRMDQVR